MMLSIGLLWWSTEKVFRFLANALVAYCPPFLKLDCLSGRLRATAAREGSSSQEGSLLYALFLGLTPSLIQNIYASVRITEGHLPMQFFILVF